LSIRWGQRVELFYTTKAHLERTIFVEGAPFECGEFVSCLPPLARTVLFDKSIPEGMPFFLDSNGEYMKDLNEFLLSLPSDGCPSPHTWQAYAKDIFLFVRFLREYRARYDVFQATRDDLRHYYRARLLSEQDALKPSSWNRGIRALEKLYVWAISKGIRTTVPFTYKDATENLPRQVHQRSRARNNAIVRAGDTDTIKCVSLDEYLIFRDVGLLGLTPDGHPDPAFRGRNGLRNAAFAELLISTGIRLEEAGSLLCPELPDPHASKWNGFEACKLQLGRKITKGNKGRSVWIPKRVLTDSILPYVQESRDNAVAKAQDNGTYQELTNLIPVKGWFSEGAILQNNRSPSRVAFDDLTLQERARLYSVDSTGSANNPCLLWTNEQGLPVGPPNFTIIFARACERLRSRFNLRVHITPHTLRHTFAVYMLNHLVRETIGTLAHLKGERITLGEQLYRRVISDPLRTLQRLLGHSSIATTYVYLTYIEETERLIDTAIGSWGNRLGRPSDWQPGVAH